MDKQELFIVSKAFEWDKGNIHKNWVKHNVTPFECEQGFFNRPIVISEDVEHSNIENRFYALGLTDTGRMLFVVFTIRRNNIRVISARDMNKKERRLINKMKKKIPKFKNEGQEREFWSRNDSTEYIDWGKAKKATLPNLKPSVQSISIRLPKMMIEELKLLANKRDVPYQSLLKMFLVERIETELKHKSAA